MNASQGGDEGRATAMLEQWARDQAAATGAVLQSLAERTSADAAGEPPARSPQ